MSLVKALFFIKKLLPTDKVKKKYICVKDLDFFLSKKNNLQAMLTGYRCS